MNALNLRELIVVVTGITILSSFLVGYLKYTAPYIKGTIHWATGTFLVGTGLLVYAFYPKPIEYINLLYTNMAAFGGHCLFLVAIWKFKDKQIRRSVIVTIMIAGFLITTFFTLIFNHMGLRVATNSILYAVAAAFVFYEMLSPPDKSLRLIFHVNAFVILIYALAMITRAIVSFPYPVIDLMAPTVESLILFSAINLSELVITFGFIIMVNVRLSQDLIRQNAMKDKFFSIIAHDLKNPIGNIMGYSEIMETKLEEKNYDEMQYISGAIRQSASQTNNLLENLLEWALSQTGKVPYEPEKINLHDFITDEARYYMPMAKSKQLSLHTEKAGEVLVWADKNMLKTILRNLVTNAVKYSYPGGNISIESNQLSSMAEVSVHDEGVGMKPEIMENLFGLDEKITTRGTRDEKGTGLGLVLCKEFTEKHGGMIRVRSEMDRGTTFSFTLPLFIG